MKRQAVLITCESCGCVFGRPPSKLMSHNFCSRPCRYKWTSTLTGPRAGGWRGGGIIKACQWCRRTFQASPSEAPARRFCSRSCNGQFHRTLVGPMAGNWRGLGPQGIREQNRLRDAARRAAGGDLSLVAWRAIKERYRHRCLCCGTQGSEENPLTIDHVIPVSRGGRHTADNIQPLCLQCNMRKHAKTIDYRQESIA